MTDGNTYAINKHLDDALLKITAEIEQAETRIERIEELEGKLARAMLTIEALQGLRPVWAQGWTDDSMAAQASGNALAQLWEMLGVKDQTQAVAALAELKGPYDE